MEEIAIPLATLGGLLLFGVLAYGVSRRVALPQVTILILLGVAAGPSGLDLLPEQTTAWFPLVSTLALLFVGFLLGGRLSLAKLGAHGAAIIGVSVGHVLGVAMIVFAGLWLAGAPIEIALLLAGIGPAAAPAAIQSVTIETRAEGAFTDTLLGVVAIDDAWGLMIFSLLLVVASMIGTGEPMTALLIDGLREIGGALLLGALLGIPSALLVRHLRDGEPMQAEALGFVLLCGGLALWLDLSFLLAAMMLGAVVVNLIKDHHEPFTIIENIEWPFLVLFFVLSGASLEIEELISVGWIGALYIALRSTGMILGAWAGGKWAGMDPAQRWWIGLAIQPQAGVALGMALIGANAFPEFGDKILTIIIGSTVIYELIGPILTRRALEKVGEAGAANVSAD